MPGGLRVGHFTYCGRRAPAFDTGSAFRYIQWVSTRGMNAHAHAHAHAWRRDAGRLVA
jgi:hypothetical protein